MMKSFINSILSFRFILSLLLAVPTQVFAQADLLPNAVQQFFDNNGKPLTSGTVDTYIAGTSTRKLTWKNSSETVTNTNPIVLDGGGKAIIYGAGHYRQVVKDRNGNLIWDAVTAPGGTVDTTAIGDGNAVGTIKIWSGLTAPNQYAFAYGQEISRTTYALLYSTITNTQLVTCTSGSPILTSVADTTQIPVGAVVENICVAPGSTVLSKTSSSFTLNNNASITTTVSSIFFLYGNGNGSTTFNLPDLRGRTVSGRNNMGGTASARLTTAFYGASPDATGASGGTQSKTLVLANLPAYTPSGTISSVFTGFAATPIGVVNSTFTGNAATPAGTIAYASNFTPAGTNAYASNFTPAGTNAYGSNFTPAGTVTKPNVTITEPNGGLGHAHSGGDLFDAESHTAINAGAGAGITVVTAVNASAGGSTDLAVSGVTATLATTPAFTGTSAALPTSTFTGTSVALPVSTFTGTSVALPAATFTGTLATPTGSVASTFTGVSATPNGTVASTFTGIAQGGSSSGVSVISPTITLNYVIKILPDTSVSTLNVVTSIDTLTGDFVCNTGITCAANAIALNLTPYIPSLTNQPAPNANNDYLILYNAGTNSIQKVTVGSVASAATSGVSSVGGATGALLLGSGLGVAGSTISNTGVLSIAATTGALSLGTGLSMTGATLNTVAPGDSCIGPRLAKTADYVVTNADRFSKFSLGGSTFFTLQFNVASGYDANYSACIHNTDTGRGKHIAVDGGKDFILWPGQVAVISNDNNSWAVRRPNRWKIPNSYGPITLQANFTLGTDALNATDCLGTNAQACKTVQGALGLAITEFDFDGNASGNSSLVVQMAAGVTDTQCVHYSTHGGIPGAQGGFAVTIQGAVGAALSCAVSGIEIYFASIVYVNGVNITSSAGYCLAAHDRAKIYVGGSTQLGPCSSGGLYAQNAKIELVGTVNIVSDMAYFALAQQQGVIATNGFAVTFLNNATFSGAFVQADSGGQVNFAGTTITVAPFAAIGTRCVSSSNGLNFSSTGVPNTYWPGTVNCSAFTQGQNL